MASDDPRPACDQRIHPDEFKQPSPKEVEANEPCSYCFPDDEIDLPPSDLLVADTWERYRRSVHRHERTGDLEWEQDCSDRTQLAQTLRSNDGDLNHPDVQDLLGGDA